MVQEDLGRLIASLPAAGGARREDRPSDVEIDLDRLAGRPPQKPDALLATFAEDPDLAASQIEARQIRYALMPSRGRCRD